MSLRDQRKKLIEIYGNQYKQVLGLENSLWFGKYKSTTIEDILETDVTYIRWCLEEKIFSLNDEAFEMYEEYLSDWIAAEEAGEHPPYGIGQDEQF